MRQILTCFKDSGQKSRYLSAFDGPTLLVVLAG